MALRIYNTLTHREEEFVALDPPMVTFYTCGPTVYDYAHIGNFRSFLSADVLRRYLEFSGYRVRQVMNLTDVGHMVDDEEADGGGPDKLEVARDRLKAAKKAGVLPAEVDIDPDDPMAVADFYAREFRADAEALGIRVVMEGRERPELLPRPTKFIPEMIRYVERLIERGHAYVGADGVVYFDVRTFPEYGRLSGNTIEKIRSGAGGRVNKVTQALKKHPADFMLWKPDPTHLMRWPSPWGEGYPGWHLECSVMATARLASNRPDGMIDLHSGGEDNIFPHHECEIAQSRAATGAAFFARYWFHTRYLLVEGEKMSKSKGSFHTIRDLTAKGFGPDAIRLELIKGHYRMNASFTWQGLKDSQRMAARWREFAGRAKGVKGGLTPGFDVEREFRESMDADLNVAGAIGAINRWMGGIAKPTEADGAALGRIDSVLGVLGLASSVGNAERGGLDAGLVESLVAEREAARKARDFARADTVRARLAGMGVEVKDSPTGPTWARRAP